MQGISISSRNMGPNRILSHLTSDRFSRPTSMSRNNSENMDIECLKKRKTNSIKRQNTAIIVGHLDQDKDIIQKSYTTKQINKQMEVNKSIEKVYVTEA